MLRIVMMKNLRKLIGCFAEYENGIRITIIELNETHYGRKK